MSSANNPEKVWSTTIDSINYYFWSNGKVTNVDLSSASAARDPIPNGPAFLKRVQYKGREVDVWSNGKLVYVATGESAINNSKIDTVSETQKAAYKESEEDKITVSDYEKMYGKYMNDGNYSANIAADPKYNFNAGDAADSKKITDFISEMGVKNEDATIDIRQSKIYQGLLASKNLLPPENKDLFTKTYRFGYYNLDAPLSRVKEYLFFTKPDLNILIRNKGAENDDMGVLEAYDTLGIPHTDEWLLNPGLLNAFWDDMYSSKKRIIKCLQSSFFEEGDNYTRDDPFIHLLANQVNTNLEIPELSADVVETAVNRYGTSIFYRGSSEPSDDGLSFSLEFKDTKWLDVYYFFRAYEEYETAKHLGTLIVNPEYIRDKILYDQMAVYKIIVDMDMETVLYWGKYYGVTPMSLPRDTFSSDTFDNGLSYSIQFKAQFYEDMKPEILKDFNDLTEPLFGTPGKNGEYKYKKDPTGNGYNREPDDGVSLYDLRPYNPVLGRVDNRPAITAHIEKCRGTARAEQSPNGYVYKLHWRGVDRF